MNAPSILTSALIRKDSGFLGKFRWRLNAFFLRRLGLLNAVGAKLSVVDAYGAPGDALVSANVARVVKFRYPRLRLNFMTPYPELAQHDPCLESLNAPEGFFSVWSWYPNLIGRKDGSSNLLSETLSRLGIEAQPNDYRARVYLTPEEVQRGRERIDNRGRPVLTFHVLTRVAEKNWPLDRWRAALAKLGSRYHLVQLGDAREPSIEGVQRLAGELSLRESMGVLANARVHVGLVSFLMHAANGLDVPSVVIYGGRETPANSGYPQNRNLFVSMACGPCWLPTEEVPKCPHGLACMEQIEADSVVAAVESLVQGRSTA